MKKFLLAICMLPLLGHAKSTISAPNVKTLQVVVNNDWLSPPIMRLQGDVLHVAFDELSHDYHRYVYRLEHCEFDWTPSEDIFESDWLQGFNDNPIEDYENSLNTTVLYTHYQLQIPNERCRLRMSGNYRLRIIDEDTDEEVACVEFKVVEPLMNVGLSVSNNTDLDVNKRYQQVAMTVRYNGMRVTNPDEQVKTLVMQNGREDNMKQDIRPNYTTTDALRWEHNRDLIFEGGNEYHKFEVLDVSHPTLGIDRITWDGKHYQAYPFVNTPRRNYLYDEDADGAFYIRNSDNVENERTCDYVYVNYKLQPAQHYEGASVIVDGLWTTEHADTYHMSYDESDHSYNATILQKQGYYSYQYLLKDLDGTTHALPEEGSFAETENRYQALVYYKGTGERTWRLVGYQQIVFK
jgi:hypothetical protein